MAEPTSGVRINSIPQYFMGNGLVEKTRKISINLSVFSYKPFPMKYCGMVWARPPESAYTTSIEVV